MSFGDAVELAGKVIDGAGVVVIVGGVALASASYVRHLRGVEPDAFTRYRQGIGRAILLGLEFLVAADIIRTVAVSPTFRSVGVLAIIVAIRTFLSMTLELELEGRWPWQRGSRAAGPRRA